MELFVACPLCSPPSSQRSEKPRLSPLENAFPLFFVVVPETLNVTSKSALVQWRATCKAVTRQGYPLEKGTEELLRSLAPS